MEIVTPVSKLTRKEKKILEPKTKLASSGTTSRATERSHDLPRDLVSKPTHRLISLSDALICRIASFLNPANAVCLSTICRRFRILIKTNKSSLSRCEKWFVMACLEQDYIDRYPPYFSRRSSGHHRHSRRSSTQDPSRTSRLDGLDGLTCALCKVKHGPETWGQTSSRFWTFTVQDLFRTKSLSRICSWHFGKVVFPIQEAVDGTTKIPRWVSSMQEMCMHCGRVQAREQCYCVADLLRGREMYPQCGICPIRKVRVYTRPGTQEDFDSVGWRFYEEKKGTMFVREDSERKSPKFRVAIPSRKSNFMVQCRWSNFDQFDSPRTHRVSIVHLWFNNRHTIAEMISSRVQQPLEDRC